VDTGVDGVWQAGQGAVPDNPDGPTLREMTLDAFLTTHARLQKSAQAKAFQERRQVRRVAKWHC
jgi:hypothetical protein